MNLVEDEEATTNKQSTSNFNFEKDLTRFALAELMKTKKFRVCLNKIIILIHFKI
jgi:hypothetical protein